MKKIIAVCAIFSFVLYACATEHNHINEPKREQSEINAAIDSFPLYEFKGLDGNPIIKTKAFDAYDNHLVFDFAYLRESSAIYFDTFSSPKMFDLKTYKFNNDPNYSLTPNYIKIERGQIIGELEIKYAETDIYTMNVEDDEGNVTKEIFINYCGVEFQGKTKMQGVLYCAPNNDAYITKGDILFYPNTNLSQFVPLSYEFVPMIYNIIDPKNNFALYADTIRIHLGNVAGKDEINQYFLFGDYIYAELTLDNLSIAYNEGMGGSVCFAELEDIKII
jgi:hypothetical protein